MLQEILIASLAVFAVLQLWFNGSIFARPRSYFQARGGLLGELLDCPLCLGFWLSVFMIVVGMEYVKLLAEILAVLGGAYFLWLYSSKILLGVDDVDKRGV